MYLEGESHESRAFNEAYRLQVAYKPLWFARRNGLYVVMRFFGNLTLITYVKPEVVQLKKTPPSSSARKMLPTVAIFGLIIPASILATVGNEIPAFVASVCCDQSSADRAARIAEAICTES